MTAYEPPNPDHVFGRPPIFRYLRPEHADAMMNLGVIRVGSLAGFAHLEGRLRDVRDGTLEVRLGGPVRHEEASEETLAALLKYGVHLGPGSSIESGLFRKRNEGWALCCARTSNNDYLRSDGRTAVVQIDNFKGLVQALGRANPNLSGMCVARRVEYAATTIEWDGEVYEADPFKKDPTFEPEDEIRLYWPSKGARGSITVVASEIIPCLRRIS